MIELNKNFRLGFSNVLELVRFVLSAIPKESSRWAINRVMVEPGVIVATDGRRLHAAWIRHDWEPGLYVMVKNTKSLVQLLPDTDSDIKFPKWRDILPSYSTYINWKTMDNYSSTLDKLTMSGRLARLGIAVNPDYLTPLTKEHRQWKVYFMAPDRPVSFICKKREEMLQAVIMTVRPQFDEEKIHRRVTSSIYQEPV